MVVFLFIMCQSLVSHVMLCLHFNFETRNFYITLDIRQYLYMCFICVCQQLCRFSDSWRDIVFGSQCLLLGKFVTMFITLFITTFLSETLQENSYTFRMDWLWLWHYAFKFCRWQHPAVGTACCKVWCALQHLFQLDVTEMFTGDFCASTQLHHSNLLTFCCICRENVNIVAKLFYIVFNVYIVKC